MRHVFTFETLLQTPVCMMTGEQLAFLVTNLPLLNKQGDNASSDTEPAKPRRLVYGIKGVADTFGCSIPTANRIKRSGVIDDAITQVGRKIFVDANLALELAASAKKERKGGSVMSDVRCYFDNDTAGRNAYEIVKKEVNAISCSEKMLPHNDVNDYLCGLRVRGLSDADADWEGKKCHSLRMTEEPSPDGRNEQLGKHH